jgi:hypothetical protein
MDDDWRISQLFAGEHSQYSEYVKNGKLPGYRRGRLIRLKQSDLDAFLKLTRLNDSLARQKNMYTSDSVKKAWDRAGGRCECQRRTHPHGMERCGRYLVWENQGKGTQGEWVARKVDSRGADVSGNYEILCTLCNKLVLFGR